MEHVVAGVPGRRHVVEDLGEALLILPQHHDAPPAVLPLAVLPPTVHHLAREAAHLLRPLVELQVEADVGFTGGVGLLLPGAPHHVDGARDPAHHVAAHRQLLGRLEPDLIPLDGAALGRHDRCQVRHLELELDAALVLGVDLDDGALGAVVRVAEHEGGGVRREELLHAAVLLELLVLHQDVLDDGLQRVRLADVVPLLLQRDPPLGGGHHELPAGHGAGVHHHRGLADRHSVPPAVLLLDRPRLLLETVAIGLALGVYVDPLGLDRHHHGLDEVRPADPDL